MRPPTVGGQRFSLKIRNCEKALDSGLRIGSRAGFAGMTKIKHLFQPIFPPAPASQHPANLFIRTRNFSTPGIRAKPVVG